MKHFQALWECAKYIMPMMNINGEYYSSPNIVAKNIEEYLSISGKILQDMG